MLWFDNPASGWATVTCYFNGAETCTKTHTADSGGPSWAFSGDYPVSRVDVYDVNNLHRDYFRDGQYSGTGPSGTHGFSLQNFDLTVE